MKFKKIMSAVLAGAMALSMSAVAFASGNETKVTGSTEVPTINVTVPTTAAFVVNPYGLSLDHDNDNATPDVTDQIISDVAYLKSTTETALRVTATVTGEAKGNTKLATATTQGAKAPTTNSVFLYFEIGKATADDGNGDPTWGTAYDAKATNQILVAAKATTKADVVVMDKCPDPTDADSATIAAYRLAGDAVSAPAVAWAATDTVDVTVAFTFLPTVVTP